MRLIPSSARLVPSTALVIALTACGGDDSLSKAEYVAQARMTCEEMGAATAAIFEEAQDIPADDPEAWDRLDAALDAQRQRVSELAALQPPAEDEDDLEAALITPLREQGEYVARGIQVFRDSVESGTEYPGLPEGEPEGADDDYLRAYGLNACAEVV